ncbi:hypothetical protein [Nocardia sp. NPDC049526]
MTTGTADSVIQRNPHPIVPKSRVRSATAIVSAVVAATGQVRV